MGEQVERRGGMGVMPVTVVCGCLCSLAGNREGASVVLEQRREGSFRFALSNHFWEFKKRERGNENMK